MTGECSIVDVGFHELQLAISLHRQWLEDSMSLNSSQTSVELAGKNILSRYLRGMRHLRDSISSQLITYDIHAMIVSTLILWIVSSYMLNFLSLEPVKDCTSHFMSLFIL